MAAKPRIIRFTDLDGNPREVEYYFSLGKTDAIELDFVHRDDPKAYLKSIAENRESRNIMEVWKDMLFRAVAVRESDGDRSWLVKNDQILTEFRGSGAYEQLFSELAESEDAGASFFLSIMPENIQEKAAEEEQRNAQSYTNQQLLEMTDEAFYAAAGTRNVIDMDKRFMEIAWQRKEQSRRTA